jgi:hypothetical protein
VIGKFECRALSTPAGSAPRSGNGHGSGNEGVGEHVRIRFHPAKGPEKLRIRKSAPNEESLFLLPDRFSKSELF